jgi:AcrR family transcriptional regulator
MARHREPVNVERQRDRIVSAATAVMARDGLQATRLRQVAIEAGLSTGSILYYFGGFDEVLVAAVRAAGAEYCTARQERIDGEPDPRSALDALVALGVPDSLSDAVRVVYQASSLIGLHSEVVPVLAEMNERQLDLYAQVIERGVAAGAFAPASEPRMIARTALALEDAFTLYLLSGYGVDAAAARAHIHLYLDHALGRSDRPARDPRHARLGGR